MKVVPAEKGLVLHVLCYFDEQDQLFVCRCLDIDVIGCGKTAEEADLEMRENVEAHIQYAIDNDLDIYRPAEKSFWDAFYKAAGSTLKGREHPNEARSLALAV